MKNLIFILVLISFLIQSCGSGSKMSLDDLRCENLVNPNAIDNTKPHFSWKIKTEEQDVQQAFYEILMASDSISLSQDKADLWSSGKTESSSSVMVPYRGKELSSRSLAYWKVRVWNQKGDSSSWSPIKRFGVGILDKNEWQGKYIGISEEGEGGYHPLLRKKFEVKDNKKPLFLHVNSLGYHEIYLNGVKVTEDVLSPAVSQLNKRSLSVTYDLTPYVNQGTNDLLIWLGRGWFRKSLLEVEHDGPLVKAQLDAMQDNGQWETILVTDNAWEAKTSGYYETGTGRWYPHNFGGEAIDGREALSDLTTSTLDKQKWQSAKEVAVAEHEVSPQMCEPTVKTDIIKPKEVKQLSDTVWLVDMGKAVTGWTEIDFPELTAGQEIIMQYSDHLNKDGSFSPQEDNGQYFDKYIGSGKGKDVFINKFNHHSFQYIRISNLSVAPKDITAYLIHTNYSDASSFECSDPDLNAIHNMIKYTLRCLSFGGYIVDCAHLERMGYGGDGNASCKTFQTMYDGSPLFANWMQMWKDVIREDGGMPHVVPNYYTAGGGPYWCGFIITGSWQNYINYGDSRLIEQYYPVMQQWLGYVDKYTVDGLLRPWPNTDYRGWYLGDWVAPAGVDFMAQNSVDLVNNCFVSDCFATMEKIASILGKSQDAAMYKERKEKLNEVIQKTFYNEETKRYGTGSQIDMAYPMLVGINDEKSYEEIKEQLFKDTQEKMKGHIGVGLVGVTILTDWAIKHGEADFIYSMLKKRDEPGYLYMIDNGATATWEHWNAERSYIHNCYNGMGAWFYHAVGGILPDEKQPGYKNILICPQIPEGVTWAKVKKETPYGTASVNWKQEGNKLTLEIVIPANSTATFISPVEASECIVNGEKVKLSNKSTELTSGKHTIKIN